MTENTLRYNFSGVNQLFPRLEVSVECSVALQLAPALLLLPATGRTRVQVTEAEEVSSEVGARLAAADTCRVTL